MSSERTVYELERVRSEVIFDWFKYHPPIYLGGLGKALKASGKVDTPGRDSN
jgi:hypothetical protein